MEQQELFPGMDPAAPEGREAGDGDEWCVRP